MRTEQVEMPAAVRSETGKIASRRLRAAGRIPAVVYGKGVDPIALAVDEATFSRAVSPAAWYHTLINLNIEGAVSGGSPANPTVMIAEVQRDPIARRVVSIDFRRVSLTERIHTQVAVRHTGESPGVKRGGIIDQVAHHLTVECLPTEMPNHLEVDISGLEIGESVRVKDIVLPPGVKIMAPEQEAVIVIAAPVKAEEVAAAPGAEGALVAEAQEPEVVGESEE